MIIIRLSGGLGNQLSQYAFGIYWATVHQTELCVDLSWFVEQRDKPFHRPYVLDYFNIPLKKATIQDFIKTGIPLRNSNQTLNILWNKVVRSIHPRAISQKGFLDLYEMKVIPNNSYLSGSWISKRYVLAHLNVFKEQFTIHHSLINIKTDLLLNILQQESVCLHIRRGDYVTTGQYLLSTSYYINSIKVLQKKITNPIALFIFSDDLDWAIQTFKGEISHMNLTEIFVDESIPTIPKDIYHFHLMKSCKHFVIANSTFSWWAALLGQHPEKIVICPSQFEASNIQHPHLILANWIPVANQ